MVDLFEKLRMEAGPLAKYSHLPDDYFFFPKLEGEIGPRMKFNGKTVLNWSLNNYLGLANHPEVRKTDAEAAAQYGMGLPMGARMMSGNSVHHLELERQLAEFEKKGDSLVSKTKLPDGEGYNIVVQFKQTADAKPQNLRFKLELNTCGECKQAEYACICGH